MKEYEIAEVKKVYKKKLKKKKELVKLTNNKNVIRYNEIMGYALPRIYTDEELMLKALKKFNFNIDYNLYINNGLYYKVDEYCDGRWIDKKYLMKISDIDKEPFRDSKNLIGEIENHFYSLEAGKVFDKTNRSQENIIIELPELKEKLETLPPFEEGEANLSRIYTPGRLNKIIRAQFFQKLMEEKIDDVINYYADSNNWEEIEVKAKEYKKTRV